MNLYSEMKRLPLWQPQIGLFKINRKCRKSCREQLHDTANLFVEEVINDTSNPLQVCITITFLLLILNCVGRKSDRKQQIHHLKMLSNPKDDYLYIKVVVTTVVVIASTMVKSSSFVILLILLLIAGDVETNPGPFTTGSKCAHQYSLALANDCICTHLLLFLLVLSMDWELCWHLQLG